MTPIQREELDKEVEWSGRLNVRTVRDGTPWAKWFMAGLATIIAIIIGAEILFHAWAFFHG
jgi:hypothetical protein